MSTTPSVEYGLLAPMLIIFGVAIAGVIVEAALPRWARYGSQMVLSIGGLIAAFIAIVALAGTNQSAVLGSVSIDGPALFLQGVIVLISLLAMMLIGQRRILPTAGLVREVAGRGRGVRPGGRAVDGFAPQASTIPGGADERLADLAGLTQTEVFPLAMFAIGGMLLFPAAGDLLVMFIALEVLSLPLYMLCALARHRRLMSQEAALKYFLLGAFSSAFFLFGIAMLYGYSGTVSLAGIGDTVAAGGGEKPLALIGAGLLSVGLLFKIGAIPFHSWVPDVYQGAPTAITAFMSSATKVAAFGALLRVFYVALPGLHVDWRPMMWAVAILTMLIGSVLAVTQTDVKRMLAYSSVSHAGFILTGVVALSRQGLSSTLFYLAAYSFSALAAFGVVGLVRSVGADGTGDVSGDNSAEASDLARWAGLGRRHPLLGTVFALLLLAFAGIPLTSGFVAKFAVFQAALTADALALVIVGVVSSGIAAFFYIRVIVLMFFAAEPDDPPTVVRPGILTMIAIGVGVVVTVVLGVAPQPLLDLADQAAQFLS
ncbi:NADH-quinone oxidoreductase subunit NuoN [Tomitella biformata]|uniref:NADH-quinone oxidoreductase subunit NuoN n=1 Tax=Tomitella biformata TaxID=630403 RepID=UPI0004650998|nr:NADH-quinone oxidoreductase subunit NuoN [Tomitella biformata]